jgi:ferredoxin-NADP reductase
VPQPIHFTATVEQVKRHDKNVATYRMRADRRLPRFIPGQFIHLSVHEYDYAGFWPESRVFSVANAVSDRQTIEITVSRQGRYTGRILDEVQVGSMLWGKGPYGQFSVDGSRGHGRTVLVAGGTGITPFCAFMDAALANGKLAPRETILHYGARAPELLIYRSLADECAVRVPGFQVFYYSEHGSAENDPAVHAGALDIDRVVARTIGARDAAYYLSGPRSMIDTFQARLLSFHCMSQEQVLIDAWE